MNSPAITTYLKAARDARYLLVDVVKDLSELGLSPQQIGSALAEDVQKHSEHLTS